MREYLLGLLTGFAIAGFLVGIWLIDALPYKIVPESLAPVQGNLGIALALIGFVAAFLFALMAIRPRQSVVA